MDILRTAPPKLKRGGLRQALIDYATDQTQKGGIETMSLRAAARDLGVSSGAVYRHFDDKDALLIEIVFQGFQTLRAAILEIRPEGSNAATPKQAIERAFAMCRHYIHFSHANPSLWRMMFGRIGVACREEVQTDPEWMRYTVLDAASENYLDLFRLGILSREPDLQDVRFIWSALHGAADLAQSGARLDGVFIDFVADDTCRRSLRSIGCPDTVINLWPMAKGPLQTQN